MKRSLEHIVNESHRYMMMGDDGIWVGAAPLVREAYLAGLKAGLSGGPRNGYERATVKLDARAPSPSEHGGGDGECKGFRGPHRWSLDGTKCLNCGTGSAPGSETP